MLRTEGEHNTPISPHKGPAVAFQPSAQGRVQLALLSSKAWGTAPHGLPARAEGPSALKGLFSQAWQRPQLLNMPGLPTPLYTKRHE